MKKVPRLTDAEYREYMDRELASAHLKYPFTEELRRELWQKIDEAGRSPKAGRATEPSITAVFRRLAWIGPAFALVIALAVIVPRAFSPSAEEWKGWKESGTTKGPIVPSEMQFLGEMEWRLKPDFKKGKVAFVLSDGLKLNGSLTNAPELNRFDEPSLRYYRLNLAGKASSGLTLEGTGKLEVRSQLFSQKNAPAFPRLADVESAELTLTFQATDHPATPPETFIRELANLKPIHKK